MKYINLDKSIIELCQPYNQNNKKLIFDWKLNMSSIIKKLNLIQLEIHGPFIKIHDSVLAMSNFNSIYKYMILKNSMNKIYIDS